MNESPSVEQQKGMQGEMQGEMQGKKSSEAASKPLCVWVDADSCPKEVRKFLLRSAKRLCENEIANGVECSVPFRFVAAQKLPRDEFPLPESGAVQAPASQAPATCTLVEPGQDASDHFILQHCSSGDIVITRDIVFAEQLCQKEDGISVLNDRGVEYTWENVSARRRQRDSNLELRQLGVLPQSPRKNHYSAKDLQQFANGFDRCLTRQLKHKQKLSTCEVLSS